MLPPRGRRVVKSSASGESRDERGSLQRARVTVEAGTQIAVSDVPSTHSPSGSVWVWWDCKCHLRRPAVSLGCAIYSIATIWILVLSFAGSAVYSFQGKQNGSDREKNRCGASIQRQKDKPGAGLGSEAGGGPSPGTRLRPEAGRGAIPAGKAELAAV